MSKYLKVMADYSSTGLWNEEGLNVEVENYPLSQETVRALKIWTRLYERNDNYLDSADRKLPMFDLKTFSKQGFKVALMIKNDLPDYQIEYFDEYMFENMDEYSRVPAACRPFEYQV